ncbi:hypothetical protein GQR58_014907 [Nymphon striatum]|nr:hypothetical protein GQR58_014907 [Nymphon striatum]
MSEELVETSESEIVTIDKRSAEENVELVKTSESEIVTIDKRFDEENVELDIVEARKVASSAMIEDADKILNVPEDVSELSAENKLNKELSKMSEELVETSESEIVTIDKRSDEGNVSLDIEEAGKVASYAMIEDTKKILNFPEDVSELSAENKLNEELSKMSEELVETSESEIVTNDKLSAKENVELDIEETEKVASSAMIEDPDKILNVPEDVSVLSAENNLNEELSKMSEELVETSVSEIVTIDKLSDEENVELDIEETGKVASSAMIVDPDKILNVPEDVSVLSAENNLNQELSKMSEELVETSESEIVTIDKLSDEENVELDIEDPGKVESSAMIEDPDKILNVPEDVSVLSAENNLNEELSKMSEELVETSVSEIVTIDKLSDEENESSAMIEDPDKILNVSENVPELSAENELIDELSKMSEELVETSESEIVTIDKLSDEENVELDIEEPGKVESSAMIEDPDKILNVPEDVSVLSAENNLNEELSKMSEELVETSESEIVTIDKLSDEENVELDIEEPGKVESSAMIEDPHKILNVPEDVFELSAENKLIDELSKMSEELVETSESVIVTIDKLSDEKNVELDIVEAGKVASSAMIEDADKILNVPEDVSVLSAENKLNEELSKMSEELVEPQNLKL